MLGINVYTMDGPLFFVGMLLSLSPQPAVLPLLLSFREAVVEQRLVWSQQDRRLAVEGERPVSAREPPWRPAVDPDRTHTSSSQTSTNRSRLEDGRSRSCSVNDFQASGSEL
jgi:hypothetical protein